MTRQDIREGNEALGPLAGDEVHARFELSNGWTAMFDSVANDGTENEGFGLQIIGSRGVIDLKIDRDPLAHWIPGNPFAASLESRRWIPISSAGPGRPEPIPRLHERVASHELAARDLIGAVLEQRSPQCDVEQAAMTIEMIHAVFRSHMEASREVSVPLDNREHALSFVTG